MPPSPLKRPHEEDRDGSSDSDSDSDFGPSLPVAAPKRKRRKLPFEKLYISALPKYTRYSKSLMHRDNLVSVDLTPITDFLITSSTDGVVKFWKKVSGAVEFVKQFGAHSGIIRGTSVSADGRSFASCGDDSTVKIFDVVTFDLLGVIDLDQGLVPNAICWIHTKRDTKPLIAVSFQDNNEIRIYDGSGNSSKPIHIIGKLHKKPVVAMAFNDKYSCVVSADEGGMIEYWSAGHDYEKPDTVFDMKSSTQLFEFKKAKSCPCSITFSPTGEHFATYSFPDRKVRVFDFKSGKLHRAYDESIATATEMQQAGTAAFQLEQVDFDKRLYPEKELENPEINRRVNVIFDESGHFVLFGSLLGTKVINTVTNKVVKVYGKEDGVRAIHLALYQGAPDQKKIVTVEMAASENPLLQEAESREAMLVETGIGKVRFYMFTNEEAGSKSERDIMNEKPRNLATEATVEKKKQAETGNSATLHTTYGDIQLKLFPGAAPKTVENFVTHSKNGYYNNVIFHRVIRKFMIQTGDPLGDGTGGESIWGREFEDEFSNLKHDKPYTLSMANAGPNTNGSQFFITTEKTPWLDKKHTIFGTAVGGVHVIHKIENARVGKFKEKPEEDIKIISISIGK